MADWPQLPRSPTRRDGHFQSDTTDFHLFETRQAQRSDTHEIGRGRRKQVRSDGGLASSLSSPFSGNAMDFNANLSFQEQQQPPPLPSSLSHLWPTLEREDALYHSQQGQQLYQQQTLMYPTQGTSQSSLASWGSLELDGQQLGRDLVPSVQFKDERQWGTGAATTVIGDGNRGGVNLSDAMLNLNLGEGMQMQNDPGRGALKRPGAASHSTASLRDQMNAQMAALYQDPKPPDHDRVLSQSLHFNQHQPLAQSGHDLLRMLNSGRSDPGFGRRELYPAPDMATMAAGRMQSPALSGVSSYPTSSPKNRADRGCPAPAISSPSRVSHSRSSTPSRTRRSQAMSPQLYREKSAPLQLAAGQGNSIHVSPEETKPNDDIKVQVALLAEECIARRVLLVGLFRLGQPTNDKPIFVKQVLFENKLHRNYRYLNTRITFRAPRSPGEFEFRVFEDKSGQGHPPNGRRQGHTNGDHHGGNNHHDKVSYSNVIIARSNRLKVCLEYSHFIDTLRATHDKFQQGVVDGDAGLVLSALLALMRLVDQVETIFLHGHTLLGDLLEAFLRLLERSADEIEMSFKATETIPFPVETFHGTLRNVFNSIEANKYVRELVANNQLADIARIQRDRFCQVSGLYFENNEDRCAFWLEHFGFAPISIAFSGLDCGGEDEMLHTAPFVTRALTQWVEREAAVLMPDSAAFRASRQPIYDQLDAEVISKLSFACELDVFGSSANEFGNEQSDMDMCLVLPELGSPTVEEKQQMLLEVVARLESRPDLFASVDTTRLTARIPIIMFVSRTVGIECDLCVENRLAQRNTALLRAYANADPRMRMLAYVIKRFVKQRRMNCAAEGTLSSYGYLLLLIHFLQRQDPPVLPVLQALPPNWPDHPCEQLPSVLCRGPSEELDPGAGNDTDGHNGIETYFYDPFAFREPNEKIALLREYCARNTQTVGELLLGFLRYYGLQFDATRNVVSVRRPDAGLVSKEEKRQTSQWRFTTRLSIEDPFEVSYDVAHVLKGSRDKYIRQQLVRAYVLLMDGAVHQTSKSGPGGSLPARGAGTDDEAVEHIMSIVNERATDVPFLQAPARPLSSVSIAT
uniref:PAP-associated domain-containing protein n=1 Tax=Peronospora matthiolae TaxID=2874970 RepID=A0AAV1T9T1_9STRA